ncbi:hypothetical protein [Cupriavidus taiwanensis]|uniref:hypothetical protein n=1 Tax=Cupriavidus taiwanensis TaxID=164546 RepID=UPI000E102BB1|nr:hypothetical protein [Cupriavidus taiwanensis]SOY56791.1 hypothetical protein CBM2592_A90086 [Cupriavidus taiwanensis]SOY90692.1 hypothetical protein CBM2591_A90085 [Cupriavidus taiwanensis]SOZ63496.1 hypothetical protein CBM2617_A70060 [Cupriavidus taiwanensis]SOZ82491.1 hypothetical protein CBM2618_A80060 [Cupriavidus taiwanensis]SOZ84381.1 hypothetical protein CBM2622_A80060 [Cupriavidus taiwanensis]
MIDANAKRIVCWFSCGAASKEIEVMDDFGNQIGAAMPGVPRRNVWAFHRFHLTGIEGEVSEHALIFYGLANAPACADKPANTDKPRGSNAWPFTA